MKNVMKIEKAVEIFEGYCRQETSPLAEDFITAVKLGIKALKLIKLVHENLGMSFGATLLGEE